MERYDLNGNVCESGEYVKFTDMLDYTLDVCNESISNAKQANVNMEIATGFRNLNIAIMKESLHYRPFGDPCKLNSTDVCYFIKNGRLYRKCKPYLRQHLVEDVISCAEDFMNDDEEIQPVKFTVWEIPNA